ncbi:hypothetical protein K439DRAFT_1637838 [Ramaria rubella]|nr:hypothetical protein K439DRAFT_1637838 [Ramaria rubella]
MIKLYAHVKAPFPPSDFSQIPRTRPPRKWNQLLLCHGPTSCHELFVVYQRHYRPQAFVAWALNGDTRDVDILHPSASRAEHTLGLYDTCKYYR